MASPSQDSKPEAAPIQFDERLEQIRTDLLAMIDLVAARVEEVTSALLERDVARADALIVGDDVLDLMSQSVEDLCIETLNGRDGLKAGDLRAVVAALHMNADIERSGDLTTNIAKAVGRLQGSKTDDRIRYLLVRMGQQAKLLFEESGKAYRNLDVELATSIEGFDDVLDELHRDYIQAVIHGATHGELLPQQSLQLALIGRFYERIGDHAENLGERIRYIVTGWTPERVGAARAHLGHGSPGGGDVGLDAVARSRGLALIDSIAEERRVDATRRDFVANVSHELKTPIGAIALLADTLADASSDDDRAALADHLNREVNRVSDIIDDLLELTRLEESAPEQERFSLDDAIVKAVDTAQGLADALGVSLNVQGVPSDIEITGERRQLVRAIVNLIDNAVRYSEPGDQVSVVVDRLVDEAEITVADTGVGIPRPELERIFERFYRVDRARSRDTGGTGLGLAIVRHVAENHGGRVLVESKVGEGSSFSLHLPLVRS